MFECVCVCVCMYDIDGQAISVPKKTTKKLWVAKPKVQLLKREDIELFITLVPKVL